MPYITKDERDDLNETSEKPTGSGQLNYAITRLCHKYISETGLCYKTLNEVVGVLECAKLELYRMIAVPYENKKKESNGPVSELDI